MQIFHNRPQLTIHKVRLMESSEVDFARLLPRLQRAIRKRCGGSSGQFVAEIENPHLRTLLNAMLDDDEIARRYRGRLPPNRSIMPIWAGCIEHVLSLCHLSRLAAAHYRNIEWTCW